jgi:hypothetical protein
VGTELRIPRAKALPTPAANDIRLLVKREDKDAIKTSSRFNPISGTSAEGAGGRR